MFILIKVNIFETRPIRDLYSSIPEQIPREMNNIMLGVRSAPPSSKMSEMRKHTHIHTETHDTNTYFSKSAAILRFVRKL